MERTNFDLLTRIKTHICYAQVFDSALTTKNIYSFCVDYDSTEISKNLSILEKNGTINISKEYIYLKDNTSDFKTIKNERIRLSDEVINDNITLLKSLSRLPFILMIGVSGSIAHKNAKIIGGELPDLDLFIITKTNSLYITRIIIMFLRKVSYFLFKMGILKKRISIDPNYLMEIDNLEVNNKSFFTAYEANSLKIIKGDSTYKHFLCANKWINKYFSLDTAEIEHIKEVNDLKVNPIIQFANFMSFSMLYFYNRINSLLFGIPRAYSYKPRPDITGSFKSIQHVGGGYQPQIAKRFGRLYENNFGKNKDLENFLFPSTTENGLKDQNKTVYTQSRSLGYEQ